jgi:DNA-binding transcriptional LysR family regulator
MTRMDRLENMRVFAAVAGAQSFAKAARRLNLSAPAVTRAVSALEEHLGTRLLHRTTRLVRLTAAGRDYLADVQRILVEIEDAEHRASGSQSEPRGQLSITAPMMFGRMHVAPVVLDFLQRHPQLSARTSFVDHVVDLLDEDLDVAVRIGALKDSSLRAVRLGSMRRVVCAAPAYLRAHGRPETPEALASHRLIAFVGVQSHRHWAFRHGDAVRSVSPTPRLLVNTADVAIAAALSGHGLTRVLAYQVEHELRAGKLAIVLADFEPPATPVHLVHAQVRNVPARVRLFAELATRRLRAVLSEVQHVTEAATN